MIKQGFEIKRSQTTNRIKFEKPVETSEIKINITEMCGDAPAAILGVRCY